MKYNLSIALDYDISTGKVNLNEIVYKLKELQDSLMLMILEKILEGYDNLIAERLSKSYSSQARHGLGQPPRPVGISGKAILMVDFVVGVESAAKACRQAWLSGCSAKDIDGIWTT